MSAVAAQISGLLLDDSVFLAELNLTHQLDGKLSTLRALTALTVFVDDDGYDAGKTEKDQYQGQECSIIFFCRAVQFCYKRLIFIDIATAGLQSLNHGLIPVALLKIR